MLAPVEVRTEEDSVAFHLPEVGEAEYLVPAAVGQDRSVPAHEAVQPPERSDPLVSRTEVEVIGVREDDPDPDLLQVP